ncbi:Protein kinase, catalytic domain-containing protein [Rozella allomycis CSF55]|uniref:cyclin-dependent kinase n=1 Tax=Rozella allomycis (strain CSF55) TaxID=988480 RepID=A0A075B4A7_ROZAC|nr:Protein kinase, catalytic domain-containing protein [Rozella allomycis CSF55]|eukprot:EPZ36165.1 Protein kinase, catalytic domain-containing protein [Rozella allomycis CSF55]
MDEYTIQNVIGQGAHGIVLKAKHLPSNSIVALKKIQIESNNTNQNLLSYPRHSSKHNVKLPKGIAREILALRAADDNPHIIDLINVFGHGNSVILSFPFMETDLNNLIKSSQSRMHEAHVKRFLRMLLLGVRHLHNLGILHRDLKPANLLIDKNGLLKIADFGLCCLAGKHGAQIGFDQDDDIDPNKTPKAPDLSHQVATRYRALLLSHYRWYRAPELLYGCRNYDQGIDIWAIGCIFAEMLNSGPLFPGQNDIDQIICIHRILGSPSINTWPELEYFPDYQKIEFQSEPGIPLERIFCDSSPFSIDLLKKFILYRSKNRISAAQVHDIASIYRH